jgi:ubiquitin carboxyl-terminal hydrolase 8
MSKPHHDRTRNCPQCKTLRKATKTLSLSRLPPVLLIHFKRFSFKGPFTDKIEKHVDFPLKGLDLTNYMPPPLPPGVDRAGTQTYPPDDPRMQIPPYRYDLYAVTNHFGSLSSGHCTWFSVFLSYLTDRLTVVLMDHFSCFGRYRFYCI